MFEGFEVAYEIYTKGKKVVKSELREQKCNKNKMKAEVQVEPKTVCHDVQCHFIAGFAHLSMGFLEAKRKYDLLK